MMSSRLVDDYLWKLAKFYQIFPVFPIAVLSKQFLPLAQLSVANGHIGR
jgi:hypothetical protein